MRLPRVKPSCLSVLIVLAAACALPAQAGRTSFEPRISALWRYTDNVNIVGTGEESADNSDSYVNLVVFLPVYRTTEFGTWGVNYAASYYRYDSNTQFDNLAHNLNFNLSFEFRRNATLSLDGFYTLSQDQGIPNKIDDEEQFLTVRTSRTYYGARIRFIKDVRRWFWQAALAGAWSAFEPIDGSLPDEPPDVPDLLTLIPEDRSRVFGYFEFRRKITPRFSLGARYDFVGLELERSGDEVYQVISLSTGWSTKKYFSIDGTVGFYERRNNGDPRFGIEPSTDTGLSWTARLEVNPPIAAIQQGKIKVGVDIGIRPSGGGSLEGTSTDSYARVYLESGRTRSPWYWSTGVRYTRRDSTLDDFPTYQTAGLEGAVEYRVGSLVSVRVGIGWAQQLEQVSGVTNASFGNAQLGVVIYPKGKASGRR